MRIMLALLIIIAFCSGCAGQQERAGDQRLRLVSLAPSTTEILFALGLDEEVVGVDTFSNYPIRVKKKEKVGSFSRPDFERIISLKPDFVFMTGLGQAYAIGKLRKLGLEVVVVYPRNFEGLFTSIRQIAQLTSREEEAEALIGNMKAVLDDVRQSVSGKKPPRVFVEVWHDPVTTVGPNSFVDEMITIAGGRNIAHDAPRTYSRFSPELVIERDPEVIILGYMSSSGKWKEALKKRVGWTNITAVKNDAVFDDINPDLFLRPGPRAILGLREIHARINDKR